MLPRSRQPEPDQRLRYRRARQQRPAQLANPDTVRAQPRLPRRVAARLRLHAGAAGANPGCRRRADGIGAPHDAFRRGTVTQLFYLTNWYRTTRLYALGFTEAARNFQDEQFRRGGAGQRCGPCRGAGRFGGTNNANFSTPPDGVPGRMQMFIFTGPDTGRDGSIDPEIVLHELTHGLSNRLIGNGSGLNWNPGAGMGEGWSDFYALSLLQRYARRRRGCALCVGRLCDVQARRSHRQLRLRYSPLPVYDRHTVNPLTWADVDDITAAMRAASPRARLDFQKGWCQRGAQRRRDLGADAVGGAQPGDRASGRNGSVPTGNHTMLQLVTDALKLTPIDPSFSEARDALLAADCATNGCANEDCRSGEASPIGGWATVRSRRSGSPASATSPDT